MAHSLRNPALAETICPSRCNSYKQRQDTGGSWQHTMMACPLSNDENVCVFFYLQAVMESRDFVSVSRRVFWSLGLELFVSRLCISYFFMTFCKEFLNKTVLKNNCSKFSRSKRSVAKLSLLLCCLRDGENNLPSTPFKIYTEFNKKCARTNDTAARNLCNERLGVLC